MIRGLNDPVSRNQPSQTKDITVCPELLKSVEDFKKFLNEQKKIREDLVNTSSVLLQNLKTDLNSVNSQVSIAVTNLRKISTSAARLKADVLKEEQHASLVNKGSEHTITDSTNLSSYFLKKLGQFETRMRLYKEELEAFEENVYSKSYTSLTSRDLLSVLTKMDHDFVDVAAQLYTVLESVKILKAQYSKNYKAIHGPNRNPFDDSNELAIKPDKFDDPFGTNTLSGSKRGPNSTAPYGPSPFSSSTTTTDNIIPNLSNLTSPDKQAANRPLTATTAPAVASIGTGFSFPSLSTSTGAKTTSATTTGLFTGFSLPTATAPTVATTTTSSTGFSFGALKTTPATTSILQPTGFPAQTTSLFKPTFGF